MRSSISPDQPTASTHAAHARGVKGSLVQFLAKPPNVSELEMVQQGFEAGLENALDRESACVA